MELNKNHWSTEVLATEEQYNKLSSARKLAKTLNRSKSWIAASVALAVAIRLYPEILKCPSRIQAIKFLIRKNKIRKLLR